jgi:hypothetical protein
MDIKRSSKDVGAVELEKVDTSPNTTKRDVDIPLTADETKLLKRATYVLLPTVSSTKLISLTASKQTGV